MNIIELELEFEVIYIYKMITYTIHYIINHNLMIFPDINDCKVKSCKNGGTCVDGINSFSCRCKPGFTGEGCSTSKCSERLVYILDFLVSTYVCLQRLF